MDTPVDDMSIIRVNTVLPSQGTINDAPIRNMATTYGVLYLLYNLLNTVNIVPECPIKDNKRLELIKDPSRPVNMSIIIAIANTPNPV